MGGRPSRRRGAGIVVLAADGLGLRAWAMDEAGAVAAAGQVRAEDPAAAVRQAVESLRGPGRRPRRAVLAVLDAGRAVLDLPIDPRAAGDAAQVRRMAAEAMREQMRRQLWTRSLGATLVGMGVLAPAAVERVLGEMATGSGFRPAIGPAAAGPPPEEDPAGPLPELDLGGSGEAVAPVRRRFGEVAMDLGLLARGDLDRALARQGVGDPGDGALACGCLPLDGAPAAGRWPWAVAAVPEAVREAWRRACAAAGCRLDLVLPLFGCAAGALDPGFAGLLVECEPGLIAVSGIADGQVVECHSHRLRGAEPADDELADLVGRGAEPVALCGRLAVAAQRAAELARRTGRRVEALPGAELALARGAWRIAVGTGAVAVPGILGRDPRPPAWTRPPWWIAAAAAVTALGLGLPWASRQAQIERLRAYAELRQEKDRVVREIAERRREQTAAEGELELWTRSLPRLRLRQAALFAAVPAAVGPGMVLDRWQGGPEGHALEGRCRDAAEANRFRQGLDAALRPEGWRVQMPAIAPGSGAWANAVQLRIDAPEGGL